MKDILTKEPYNFRYAGYCNCIGPKTEKYKKSDYVLYFNIRTRQFKIKKFGKVIKELQPEAQIKTVLNELFQTQN